MLPVKAIVLAAGYGTRLYPLTENTPKPLLEVGGKTIIDWAVRKISEVKAVDEIFVVTNAKFASHFEIWKGTVQTDQKITIVNDGTMTNEDRLGSLGDIRFVVEKFHLQDDLLIVAGDNLFDFSLADFVSHFENQMLVALHDVGNLELAKSYGVVSIDGQGKVTDFTEKPDQPQSTLISTAIYLYPQEILSSFLSFTDSHDTDRAGDFLAWLYPQKTVQGVRLEGKWFDIGSLEQLEEARGVFTK